MKCSNFMSTLRFLCWIFRQEGSTGLPSSSQKWPIIHFVSRCITFFWFPTDFFFCFLKRTQLLSDLKQNSLHFFYQCSLHARIHAAKFFPYCIFLTVSNVISLIFKVFPSYVVMDLWPGNSQNYLLMLGQYFYRTILMGRKRLNQ